MLGVHGKPMVNRERKIVPLTAANGCRAMSIEFFLDREDQAITWRGPMLHKAIRQFLEDVEWGELDYLLIDLPPGTGDVSMTLAQLLPQARFVIVTTPQPAAQKVAQRAAETAQRFGPRDRGRRGEHVRLHDPERRALTIFGEGGGQLLADDLDVPLLGKIPLQEELRIGSDEGRPLVIEDPDAPASQAIFHAARGLIAVTPQEPAVLQQPLEGGLEPPPASAVPGVGAADGAVGRAFFATRHAPHGRPVRPHAAARPERSRGAALADPRPGEGDNRGQRHHRRRFRLGPSQDGLRDGPPAARRPTTCSSSKARTSCSSSSTTR